jgi:hypothetical protein
LLRSDTFSLSGGLEQIHHGATKTILDFQEEIGRTKRSSGQAWPAVCIVFFFGRFFRLALCGAYEGSATPSSQQYPNPFSHVIGTFAAHSS